MIGKWSSPEAEDPIDRSKIDAKSSAGTIARGR